MVRGLRFLVAAAAPLAVDALRMCHMMYLNADNDLEGNIVADVEELIGNSAFLSREGYALHILIDRHAAEHDEVLRGSYDENGNVRDEEAQGAMQYEYVGGQLRARSGAFAGQEANMDSSSTLESFLKNVLPKCVAAGTDSYFFQAGSHGAGWMGFGGDDLQRRLGVARQRRLGGDPMGLQAMAGAIGRALAASSIARLDMVGFDACLMSSVSVMKAFSGVATYLLASEPTEPAHGWDYSLLKADYATIQDLATDIIDSYTSSMHGQEEDGHETPKMLTLTDLQKYPTFEAKFEAFFSTLTLGLNAKDRSVRTALSRAITSSLRFIGGPDGEDSKGRSSKSATDVGSFLTQFKKNCASGDEVLQRALRDLETSYTAMILHFKVGPGSPPAATGVSLWLPTLRAAHDKTLDFFNYYMCSSSQHTDCEGYYYDEVPTALATFMQSFYAKSFQAVEQAQIRCSAGEDETLEKPEGSISLPRPEAPATNEDPQLQDGCWEYPEGSLVRDGSVLCKASTFSMQVVVADKVEYAEASFTVSLKDVGSQLGYVEIIAQVADAAFSGQIASASFDGYIYKIDGQVVSTIQNGARDMHTIEVHYFPPGVNPVVTATTLSNNGGHEGYLQFTSRNGVLTSGLSLFVDFDGATYSAVSPDSGTIVPIILTLDAVRYGSVLKWTSDRSWSVSGISLGSDVAKEVLYEGVRAAPAHVEMMVDTDKSIDTDCYAEVVSFELENEAYCSPAINGAQSRAWPLASLSSFLLGSLVWALF